MTKNKLSYFLLYFLLFVSALQFSSIGITDEVYGLLRTIIIGVITLTFITSFKNPRKYIKRISVVKTHTVCLVFFLVAIFIFYAFGADVNFSPAQDLTIALLILIIGLNIDVNEKQFKRLVSAFVVFYTLSALSIVFTYASGFVIQDQYLAVPKNQLAPVYGVAFIIAIYFAFKGKGVNKFLYYTLAGLLMASLLVIRGRAVIVAVFVTSFIFMFYYVRNMKYRIVIIVVILAVLPFIGQFVYDALFLNYDVTDLDSLSTGRMERNTMGLVFIMENLLFGELFNQFRGNTIHNYILISLVSYGLLLGSLLLTVYFKYIFTVIRGIKNNSFGYYEIGPLVMVVLLIVSLFEYTYPYAPGSAVFFPFLLMGQYLKSNNKIRGK